MSYAFGLKILWEIVTFLYAKKIINLSIKVINHWACPIILLFERQYLFAQWPKICGLDHKIIKIKIKN